MKKLLLFGAGKIGRSFIGQLFSRSGYEVVFVDIDQKIINRLNECKEYKVVIKEEEDAYLHVNNVRGIHFSNESQIIDEIYESSTMAVSVGKNGINAVIPLIAKGLLKREKSRKGAIDLIIAENMRNADVFIYNELEKILPRGFPLNQQLGLVETSIGKMVPIMPTEVTNADPLLVYAEAYNTLILDKNGFLNEIPDVAGLSPKENMKAWVDRKLFIHNFGHAATAYLGYSYNPSFIYTWQALQEPEIHDKVFEAMKQSATALHNLYPDEFTVRELDMHMQNLLDRFQNKNLGDTIYRVGCDLYRKLGPNDRVITPLRTALNFGLPFKRIAEVLFKGLDFEATNPSGDSLPSDLRFFKEKQKGSDYVLQKICKLSNREIETMKNAG